MFTLSPVSAHEFWLEPQDFTVARDVDITADLRVGQNFKGDRFPYLPSRFKSFKRYDRVGESDVEGTVGDIPALRINPRSEGLAIFTYVSAGQRIMFRDWEKFNAYLDYEGLDTVAADHEARGLPRDEISEIFIRCAKTLVNVGEALADGDRATGMRFELVAGENPGVLKPGSEMVFTLLWEGAPRTNTQVALFRRDEDGGDAIRTITRTNADGVARFVIPVSGIYLAAAVRMIDGAADSNVDWQSYWASLSFAVEE